MTLKLFKRGHMWGLRPSELLPDRPAAQVVLDCHADYPMTTAGGVRPMLYALIMPSTNKKPSGHIPTRRAYLKSPERRERMFAPVTP